jgi:DNA-binding HxlR family transcriptional regulator
MATATTAQRRSQATARYDAFLAACPTRNLLAVLTDKWVCLVLCALTDGPMRHGELGRRISGVSQKMLTQTLRGLERDGILVRTATASVPMRVDYELTDLGRSLCGPLAALKDWAEAHMDDVFDARARHESVSGS